jgi:hypothetical protein
MTGTLTKLTTLVSSAILVTGLSGCETSGTTRISSVGKGEPQGTPGPQGPAGPQGAPGPQGPAGASGSGIGLGSAGALAVGGLVGPNGVAGTGLLANTGDPNSRIPLISGVLVATGGALQTVSGQGTIVGSVVDSATPGGISVAGRVIGVVQATGDALIRTGNGQQYLVDGLTAAPGQLVNLTLGNATVLGSSGQSPLVGASVLSPTQTQGNPLTVGVGSGGQLLTLGTTSGQGSTNHTTGVVGGVTNVLNGGPSQPTGVVQGVVQGVTNILGGREP